MIAGLEQPTSGTISIGDRDVTHVDAMDRNIAMVFQNYALYPHMNVFRNMAFGLQMRKVARQEIETRVGEAARSLGIDGLLERRPAQLCGGERQRVALGRAIVRNPEVFLLDEPLSNLDARLRVSMRSELVSLRKGLGATMVYVTHDQVEAMTMGDRIVVMRDGRIHQVGTPRDVYLRPANRFVADFIGEGAFLPADVISDFELQLELGVVHSQQPIRCAEHGDACGQGCAVDALLRPDDVVHDDASPITAEVVGKAFRGAEFLYTLRLPSGATVLSLVPSHHNHGIGERIGIRLEPDHVVVYRRD